jgi:predicted CopG family antitoxin
VADPKLDTIEGCIAELTDCNRTVAEISADYPQAAGKLKMLEKRYDRLYKTAMRTTTGKNADERQATAHVAAEETYRTLYEVPEGEPGISELIEALIGRVEEYKRTMEVVDRRSGNVQSILKARREQQGLEQYVPSR